jgi:hypothetical protein
MYEIYDINRERGERGIIFPNRPGENEKSRNYM